jgi:polyisoprenoid-binding protein YceI
MSAAMSVSFPDQSAFNRRQMLALALGATLLPLSAREVRAAPQRYGLDRARSSVGFAITLNGAQQRGTMPVQRADLLIDPGNLSATRVAVDLDVAQARTSLFLITRTMLGPEVLDAGNHPLISFRSTRIRLNAAGQLSGGARVAGDLTIRGATRPVTLAADVFRRPGSAPDDLDELTVNLRGQISRKAFGASGFADLVADRVAIDIRAVIRVTN